MKQCSSFISKGFWGLVLIVCLPIALVRVSIEQLPNLIPDRWISPKGRNRLRAVIPWLWFMVIALFAWWLFVVLQASKPISN
ncbi:MAG: hypothetical protein ACF8OB_16445 [Phycisphaeraceae bacterium JB051]